MASSVHPVSEAAIRKLAQDTMKRDNVSEATAFKRAQRWADKKNAQALGPPAPRQIHPSPRCGCDRCNAHFAELAKRPKGGSAYWGGR